MTAHPYIVGSAGDPEYEDRTLRRRLEWVEVAHAARPDTVRAAERLAKRGEVRLLGFGEGSLQGVLLVGRPFG